MAHGVMALPFPSPSAGCSPDGSRSRVLRVGGSEHLSADLDGVETLPDHADDRSRQHVSHKRREEARAVSLNMTRAGRLALPERSA